MPANVKVLIVDDNPMVLGMLKSAVGAIATVSTATDGGDALLKAVEEQPDLVITDYTMGGMDGRALFEKLKTRTATAKIPIILAASKADITDKLKMLQDQVEDFLEKPFFIKEATAKIKKVVDKIALEKMAREAPGEGVLRGSLAQMNIMDLLQSLEMGRKSCLLTITYNGEKCDMFFSEGQINHAVYGSTKGDDAVYKTMGWTGGRFHVHFT